MNFEIKDLFVAYGGIHALTSVSLEVREGEIVCLIGANGAGKSTLLRSISGLIKPKKGSIVFNNTEIAGVAPHKIVALGISHSPEGRRVFATLTVGENLLMGSYVLKKKNKATFDFVLETFPILKERLRQYAGTLSGGEQQMLAIGRSLMAEPKLLLLDEPSLGLAPIITKELFSLIKKINEARKISILIVEQNAKAALKLSKRGYVLDVGKITFSGDSKTLQNSPELKESYLGKGA
ncbi:MAG: ABC transporter ATP-binding protein [Deferribacteraceae bacterium]|nr:ABC transporter ATP-binding protein [Deferribacteraceae bacterium]